LTRERNVFSSAAHSERVVNYGNATSKKGDGGCAMQNFRFRGSKIQNGPVDQTSAPTRAAGSTGSSRIAESVSSAGRSQANLVHLAAAVGLNLVCFGQVGTTVARFTTTVLNNISSIKKGKEWTSIFG
jgi:hypothetical protein